MRYETPEYVASMLPRYAPPKLRTLLDPATGSGVLIRPFLRRNPRVEATCIDIDPEATSLLQRNLGSHRNVEVITKDFLRWCGARQFDCVVMNPPFASRKQDLVKLTIPGNATVKERDVFVGCEMAFVLSAINLLRAGGRLIAILPASIISSDSGHWLRKVLMLTGAVKLVHELPARTFHGIEAKTFLLVYERGGVQSGVSLRNHRLRCPDELIVPKKVIETNLRFDYGFHDSMVWYQKLRSLSDLGWVRLADAADCWRGEVDSPVDKDLVLHTTNLQSFRPTEVEMRSWIHPVRHGDLIVKRVGRQCAASWIPYMRKNPARCSDCLFIVRSNREFDSIALLFALRVLLASVQGSPLVERGIGAAYLTFDAINDLWIPYSLHTQYSKSFESFKSALRSRKWTELMQIEGRVRQYLQKRIQLN